MLGKKLGIDAGSSTLRVFVRGEGVVVSEPSLVALEGAGTLIGAAALEWERRTGGVAVRPVQQGRMRDAAALEALIQAAVTRVAGRQRIFKPDMVMVVMSSLPGPERRLLLDVAAAAGARTVYLLDAPIAAAMGARLPLSEGRAHLIVDAGAGKTEVCVVVEEGSVAGRCLAGGTSQLRSAAAAADAGGAPPAAEPDSLETDPGAAPYLDAYAGEVADAVQQVLDETPPGLLGDIRREGIIVCGGGARIARLRRGLTARFGIEARVIGDPLECAVRGAGLAVDNLDMLRRNVMYLR